MARRFSSDISSMLRQRVRRFSKSNTENIPDWNDELMDKINSLTIGGLTIDMSHKFDLLEELLDMIECPMFVYSNESELMAAKEGLLALWVMILTNIEQISVLHYKHMCFRLISACMRREEFQLQSLPIDYTTKEVSFTSEVLRLTRVYRQLVRDSFLYASKLLTMALEHRKSSQNDPKKASSTNQSNVMMCSPEVFTFCAQVIVAAYFTFPAIQAPLVDTFCWSYCHVQGTDGTLTYCNAKDTIENSELNWYKVMEDDLRIILESSHPEDMAIQFMESNPDLFQWNTLSTPSDSKVLPEDDLWRKIISLNGFAFVSMLKEFVSYIDTICFPYSRSFSSSSTQTRMNGKRTRIVWRTIPGYEQFIILFCCLLQDVIMWSSSEENERSIMSKFKTSCDVDFHMARERKEQKCLETPLQSSNNPEKNEEALSNEDISKETLEKVVVNLEKMEETNEKENNEEERKSLNDEHSVETDSIESQPLSPKEKEERRKSSLEDTDNQFQHEKISFNLMESHHTRRMKKKTMVFNITETLCDETLECASILVQTNPSLVGLFCKLILNGMNYENPSSISKTFHYISKWMLLASSTPGLNEYMKATSLSPSQRLPLQSAKFPTAMDTIHLIHVCLELLRSKDSSILVTTLAFLYNHLDGMDVHGREKIALTLIQEHFFTLFLHWRFEVRCCFHHILVFKLLRYDRRRLSLTTDRRLLYALREGLLNETQNQTNEALIPIDLPMDTQKPENDPYKTIDLNEISSSQKTNHGMPNICENPHMILDVALSSKIDVYIQILCQHRRRSNSMDITEQNKELNEKEQTNPSKRKMSLENPFPEDLEIFLRVSMLEYAYVVRSYYHFSLEVETLEKRSLRIHEAIEGPDLSAVLVKRSPVE